MRSPKGFGLIELVVVMAIVGILAAISMPSYLNQASNASELEAIQNLALVLRRQQGHYQEHGVFAKTWSELALGFGPTTDNYTYEVFLTPESGTGILINQHHKDLRSYLGGVKMVALRESRFVVAQCKAIKRGDLLKTDSLLVGKYQVRCGRRVEAIP